MRTNLVAMNDPVGGHAAYLAERDVAVEHLLAVSTVEAFDQTVLHRSIRLDEATFDAMPTSHFASSSLINSGPLSMRNPAGFAKVLDELVERSDDASCRQTRVDFGW